MSNISAKSNIKGHKRFKTTGNKVKFVSNRG